VAIGTLEDLDVIGRSPAQTFETRQLAGLDGLPRDESQRERSCDIMGWSLRLVDASPGP
jgi:hypothetical protein